MHTSPSSKHNKFNRLDVRLVCPLLTAGSAERALWFLAFGIHTKYMQRIKYYCGVL